MKRIFTFIALAVIMSACNFTVNTKKLSGVIVTEEFELSRTYKSLKVSQAINVVCSPDVKEMKVTADSVVLEEFDFSCVDGVLEIGRKEGVTTIYNGIGKIDVVVPVSRFLNSVSVSEASSVSVGELVRALDFTAVVGTASKFEAELQVRNLTLTVSEASAANISGIVSKQLMGTVTTASKLSSESSYLKVEDAYVNISGASKAFLSCDDEITGTVSGASYLRYFGEGKSSVAASGASKVISPADEPSSPLLSI